MEKLTHIRTQKLFLVILILKVAMVGLGSLLHSPVWLGSVAPLTLIGIYIAIGLKRQDKSVTDEKFADSCYYLGFIFTITSIIFSLFDLPSIGTHIQDIAYRFGAAMISTVLGLGVRVYLVGFKRDAADAIQDAEGAVIEAAHNLREQLSMAVERLKNFQSEVDVAARGTVERVNLQIESLSKNHAEKLGEFFGDLTARNAAGFKSALEDVQGASSRLSAEVDRYAIGLGANLQGLDSSVKRFSDGVSARLEATVFPDDYFAKHLAVPLSRMQVASSEVSDSVRTTSVLIGTASETLTAALRRLQTKALAVDGSLDKVLQLTEQQQAVLGAAEAQTNVLWRLGSTLDSVQIALGAATEATNANNAAASTLAARLTRADAEAASQEGSFEQALSEVKTALAEQTSVLTTLSRSLLNSVEVSKLVSQELSSQTKATAQLSSEVASSVTANSETSAALARIASKAVGAVGSIDGLVNHLASVMERLSLFDATSKQQTAAVIDSVKRIENIASATALAPTPAPFTSAQAPSSATTSLPNAQFSSVALPQAAAIDTQRAELGHVGTLNGAQTSGPTLTDVGS